MVQGGIVQFFPPLSPPLKPVLDFLRNHLGETIMDQHELAVTFAQGLIELREQHRIEMGKETDETRRGLLGILHAEREKGYKVAVARVLRDDEAMLAFYRATDGEK